MRPRRVRFTLRSMMIIVAVAALSLAYLRARDRWAAYRVSAAYHGDVEKIFRLAVDGRGFMYKSHPELESFDPEPPPLSPWDDRAWELPGCLLQADYHARMRAYWESRW
jgi:hypothetical protein